MVDHKTGRVVKNNILLRGRGDRRNLTAFWNISDADHWEHLVPWMPEYCVGQMGIWAQHQRLALADSWWVCGFGKLWSVLPRNWRGLCTRVMISSGVTIVKRDTRGRQKLSTKFDRTEGVYIDAIGQPRGVPDEFKARNEIAAGFESIIPSIGVNKNLEWLIYIYFNQQRFLNFMKTALTALGQQLSATSRMAWQNRQILDWMLGREGGVCSMFGEKCCTFILNHTEPEGEFYEAMKR